MEILPRFTLNGFKEAGIKPPSFSEEVSSSLINESKRMLQSDSKTRIKSIDDNILFKCKPNDRSRGAIWIDQDNYGVWWIVSAGTRTDGSPHDFYQQLESKCRAKLKEIRKTHSNFNRGKNTYSDWLLPEDEDYDRLISYINYLTVLDFNNKVRVEYNQAQNNVGEVFTLLHPHGHIQFGFATNTGVYIKISANDYNFTTRIANIVIYDILGFTDDTCQETTTEPLRNFRYTKMFYCILG